MPSSPSRPRRDIDDVVDAPVHDRARALRRMGEDRDLYREMIRLLYDDGPRCLDEVRTALNQEDFCEAERAAHTLKGLAGNFEALRTMASAERVQSAAKAGSLFDLRDGLGRLEMAFAELVSALSQELDGPASQ